MLCLVVFVGVRGHWSLGSWFLWPLDNVLRTVDFGDAFQVYGWRLRSLDMGIGLATLAVVEGMSCPAEACVTMNGTWGYKRDGGKWKTGEELLQLRRRAAWRGCNLLLNVGPMADGRFPPEAVERLDFLAGHRDLA